MSSPCYTGSLRHTCLDRKEMPLYVTKIIRNIHWNHNATYNLVVYLFVFNNHDTTNDQLIYNGAKSDTDNNVLEVFFLLDKRCPD